MATTRVTGIALVVVFLLSAPGSAIDTLFVDVSDSWQLSTHRPEAGHGTGAAAADFNGDGLIDLFVPQATGVPDRLYRNEGDQFVDIAATVGLATLESSRTALWLDFDGDHDLDLWVANDNQQAPSSFTLYRQDPGPVFTDVTVAAGVSKPPIVLQSTHHWAALCAGDVNNDGYLDVFTAQWPGPGHLFLNTGSGAFVDISDSSGVALERNAHQCAMADFDGDGWTDIYVAIDFEPNLLWLNQHDNTFLDVAPAAGLDNAMNDMGMALGDFDDDGDFDLYVTNIYLPDHEDGPRHNVLLENRSRPGELSFVEVAAELGVDQSYWGWGTTFLDADNDGDLDLAATNGWRSGESATDPSRFFENAGPSLAFSDVSSEVQFADTDWGSGLLAADFDRDGDLDLLQTCMSIEEAIPLRLLDNQRPVGAGHYLVIQPRMPGTNHFAVGATIRVRVGDRTMSRRISAGTGYMGQEPHEAFFGLGATTSVDSVHVDWPDGTSVTLLEILGDQVLRIDQTFDVFSDGFESGNTERWSLSTN